MGSRYVFGLHAVTALLENAPQRVREIRLVSGRQDQRARRLISGAEAHGIPVTRLERKALDEQFPGSVHQGVVASVAPPPRGGEQALAAYLDGLTGPPLLLVLDQVQDPHNLGACLRTADAAGVDAVIVPRDRAAGLTPAASKVASGAAETVPFFQVTNLARTLAGLQERGIWVIGTADEAAATLYEVDLTGPLALVMGSEGRGLRRLTRARCDREVRIPMAGLVGSLNVSVAAGVVLFEARRQRGQSATG